MIYIIIATLIYLYLLIHSYYCNDNIECLSDIAYDKHNNMFKFNMIALAVCLLLGILEQTPNQLVTLLGCLGIVGLGITPYKDNKIYYYLHYASTLIAMGSILYLWASIGMFYIPIFYLLASLRKKWLLGVEMGLLVSALTFSVIILNGYT